MAVDLKSLIIDRLKDFTEYLQLSCGHLIAEPLESKEQVGEEAYYCFSCDGNKSRIYNKDLGIGKYPKEVIHRLYKIAIESTNDDQIIQEFRNLYSKLDVKFFPDEIKKAFEAVSNALRPSMPVRKPANPIVLPPPAKAQVEKVLVELENSDLLSFSVSKRKGGIYFELIVKSPSELAKQLKSEGVQFETIDLIGFYESGDINMFKKLWRKIHGLIGFDDANQISNLVSPYLVAREAIPPLPPAWDPVPFAPLQEAPEIFWSNDSEQSEFLLKGNGKSGFIGFSISKDKKTKKIRIELETESRHYIGEGLEELNDLWRKVQNLKILDQRAIDKISEYIKKIGASDAEIDLTCKESLRGSVLPSYGSFENPVTPLFRPIKEYEEGGELLAEFDSTKLGSFSALPSAEDLDGMNPDELAELLQAIDLSNQPDADDMPD